jgi:acyl carrier protein
MSDIRDRFASLSPDKKALLALRLAAADTTAAVSSGKSLVAYLVVEDGQQAANSAMLDFLRRRLPDYMLPSRFVTLEALPLSPNGKVDRRALPAPGAARPEPESTYVAPRTPMEEALAEIWSKVLKLDRVGVLDSFFDLGGHSLLATQALSRIRSAFKVDIPLRTIFENVTVAALAAAILQHQAEQADKDETALLLKQVENLTDEQVESLLRE